MGRGHREERVSVGWGVVTQGQAWGAVVRWQGSDCTGHRGPGKEVRLNLGTV